MTTYNIQINETQRELISRALDHLYEVDIEFHEDLVIGEVDSMTITQEQLTEKGKDLYNLYKMFGTDTLEKDGGLLSNGTLNGLTL